MKKAIKLTYLLVLAVFCLIPVLMMPFFGSDSSAEKRELSAFPSLVTEDGGLNADFCGEVDTYLNEHFSFREQFVTANSLMKATLFQTSAQDQIIVGKNDWLYFSKTLDDYTGKNALTDRQIDAVAKVIELTAESVEASGADFLFFVAPNKNTIYPENMPYYYTENRENANLTRLSERLADKDYYLDLTEALSAEGMLYYHKRDSHWNNMGANVAFESIMTKLGKSYTDYTRFGGDWQTMWDGDLDAMIFPSLGLKDDQFIYNYQPQFTYATAFRGVESITIQTVNEGKSGSLFMARDSFGNALYPFMAEEFGSAEFSRVTPYRLSEIAAQGVDTVVIELVERNLGNLLENSPIIAAPSRTLDRTVELETGLCESVEASGMRHVYGTLTEEYNGDVFIETELDGARVWFEAFPTRETELIGDAEGYGFSAYIPLECDGAVRVVGQ